ncbi:hypothetical protein M2352_003363 [Azospirillum fermentarium]|uniref:TIR domain-containing protein n=1 Tax=Azospirillum fermentarium TaxID=1233114 RepID=UPI0022275E13|nr:TIR domain-containing protein [Azospirillum fermentarium]MCW2247729.1 hypothetical protein [Azospirillum fermentarium]
MSLPSLFLSYSSKDVHLKNQVVSHFSALRRAGIIDMWTDDRIAVGDYWRQEIEEAIERAAAAVFLITANFLASDFINDEEVPRLLERQRKNGLAVIPVIARPCAFELVKWLDPVQVRPRGYAVWSPGSDPDIALANITREIAHIFKNAGHTDRRTDHLRIFSVRIKAPDGTMYEANGSDALIVGEVLDAFIESWRSPQDQRSSPMRFSLHLDAEGAPKLDTSISLRAAGVTASSTLRLDASPLVRTDTVGLTVMVDNDGLYSVASSLDVTVEELASDLLTTPFTEQDIVVEQLASAAQPARRLTLDQTLFDACVNDRACLRIQRRVHH